MRVTEVQLICALFIHSFNNQILSPFCVLDTVLGLGKTAVNENFKVFAPMALHIPLGKKENKMYM